LSARQFNQKLPVVVVTCVASFGLLTFGLLSTDSESGAFIFFGIGLLAWTVIFLLWGKIDLSEWNQLKSMLRRSDGVPPIEIEEEGKEAASDHNPTHLSGLPTSPPEWIESIGDALVLIFLIASAFAALLSRDFPDGPVGKRSRHSLVSSLTAAPPPRV